MIAARRRGPRTDGYGVMWVIYLEVVIALSLVLLIVWWTMRGRK
jgi:hypothetical protein